MVAGPLSELLVGGLHWLASVQNSDGGWGDCDGARSSLAATAMVLAAFRLTGVPAKYADLLARADEFICAQDGLDKLRQPRQRDRTWAAPILTACALAEMVPWCRVPAVAFERYGRPANREDGFASRVDEQGSSHAVHVAAGLARFHHAPPRNPLRHWLRRRVVQASLQQLELWQAADGSFAASPLATAFVVINLAGSGARDHAVVQKGVEYLFAGVRADVTWTVVSDLSIRNTSSALAALCSDAACVAAAWEYPNRETCETRLRANQVPDDHSDDQANDDWLARAALEWLLSRERKSDGSEAADAAGGWAWSDSPGAIVNVVDTAKVLTTLARWRDGAGASLRKRVDVAATRGLEWLIAGQHASGGWATFVAEDNQQQSRCSVGHRRVGRCDLRLGRLEPRMAIGSLLAGRGTFAGRDQRALGPHYRGDITCTPVAGAVATRRRQHCVANERQRTSFRSAEPRLCYEPGACRMCRLWSVAGAAGDPRGRLAGPGAARRRWLGTASPTAQLLGVVPCRFCVQVRQQQLVRKCVQRRGNRLGSGRAIAHH